MKNLLFIPLLFISCVAFASPTISSVSNDTISGTAFGTKSSASPSVYDSFEDGSCNTSCDIGTIASVNDLVINSDNLRGTSSYNATCSFVSSDTAGVRCNSTLLSENWYASYWFKLDSNWDWGTSTYGSGNQFLSNIKIFRLWNPGSVDENFVTALQGWGNNIMYTTEYTEQSTLYYGSGYRTDWTINTWHRLEFQFSEASGVSVADGTIKVWFDGELILDNNDIITRKDYDVDKRPFIVGFYNSWGTDAGSNLPDNIYIDDIYIDNTWQRIEIGNNPMYSSCTHREIQIPTAWSDTSISVTWNQGSFEDYETVWLFVVDSDGNVSEGLKGYFSDGTFYSGCSSCSATVTGTLNVTGTLEIL